MRVKLRVVFALLSGLLLCAAVGDMSGVSVTVQGFTRTLAQWLSLYNVVIPTNSSADVTNLQNAVNGVLPVRMAAGTFQVCSQVALPVNQRVEGIGTYSNPGSNGPSTSNSKTIVTCSTNGTFSSGQGYFAMKDHDVIDKVDFYCNAGLNPQYNGINALNAISVEFSNGGVYFCKEGISRLSDGSVPGASASYSQLAKIHGNIFYENSGYGYFADFANGGFVSDEMIYDNDFVLASGTTGGAYFHFAASIQFNHNRCEVGGAGEPCVTLSHSGRAAITANNFEQTQALLIDSSDSVAVAGNYGNSDTFGALLNVEFAGANTNIQLAGNVWTGAAIRYKVDAGGTFDNFSTFAEYANAPNTIYNDAYTQSIMQPLTVASAGVVNNNAALAAVNTVLSPAAGNHISSRGFAPAVSACGTGCVLADGDDYGGDVTMGSGSPTSVTITFGVPFSSTPICTPSTNSASSVAAVTAKSATAITISLSVAATSVGFNCHEAVANIIPAGVGLTSGGWAANTSNATFATAAAAGPAGATDAARLTENAVFQQHYTSVNITAGASGTYTMSAYIHAGSSGARDVGLLVFDSGFGNSAGASFSPIDGSFVGTYANPAGAGLVIGHGSKPAGNGWYRVWMTTTGVWPAWEILNVMNGTQFNFQGDGASNVLVWGPALRAGTLP